MVTPPDQAYTRAEMQAMPFFNSGVGSPYPGSPNTLLSILDLRCGNYIPTSTVKGVTHVVQPAGTRSLLFNDTLCETPSGVTLPDGSMAPCGASSSSSSSSGPCTFGGGTGDVNSPYQITNCAQLQCINNYPLGTHSYFKQTANVDCAGVPFTPININSSFGFHYDGGLGGIKYEIKNVSITTTVPGTAGIFKALPTVGVSEIKNLTIRNVNINTSGGPADMRVGGLVGVAGNGSDANVCTFNNIDLSGSITSTSTNGNVGGLIGQGNAITANDIVSSISLQTTNAAETGGLVGTLTASSRITQSVSTGTIAGSQGHGGGLVGSLTNSSTILNSAHYGSVTGFPNAGGIVGTMGNSAQIRECAATGTITGSALAGGIAAQVGGSGSSIADSRFYGSLNSSTASGGITCGIAGSISLSKNFALVESFGGVQPMTSMKPSDPYWNGVPASNFFFSGYTPAHSVINQGTPLDLSQLAVQSSFTGFTFLGGLWRMPDGNSPYITGVSPARIVAPVLRWECDPTKNGIFNCTGF